MISHVEALAAIIAVLKADARLRTFVGERIFNHVPQDEINPCIRVRIESGGEWDTKTSDGWQNSVRVDVWSEYQGDKESLEIADIIDDILHDASLSLASSQSLLLRHDTRDAFTEPDGATHHTVLRYLHIITT